MRPRRLPDPLGDAEWSRHAQDEWERRAGDRRLPHWLRLAALAYAKHGNNGHAAFKRGDVAVVLGVPGAPLDRRQLHEYIQRAIELGWLADGSTSMCLVVPSHIIDKGHIGEPKKACRVHQRRKQVSYSKQDSLFKVSGAEQDSSPQLSGSKQDSLRSAPISYPNRNLTAVPDHPTGAAS